MYNKLAGMIISGQDFDDQRDMLIFEDKKARLATVYMDSSKERQVVMNAIRAYKRRVPEIGVQIEFRDWDGNRIELSAKARNQTLIFDEFYREKDIQIKPYGKNAVVLVGRQIPLKEEIYNAKKRFEICGKQALIYEERYKAMEDDEKGKEKVFRQLCAASMEAQKGLIKLNGLEKEFRQTELNIAPVNTLLIYIFQSQERLLLKKVGTKCYILVNGKIAEYEKLQEKEKNLICMLNFLLNLEAERGKEYADKCFVVVEQSVKGFEREEMLRYRKILTRKLRSIQEANQGNRIIVISQRVAADQTTNKM